MSRALTDLLPPARRRAVAFLDTCKAAGIDVIITSTLRTNAQQDALYAQGRTAPGKVVTNARAGQSWHNYGLAFDFCPIVNGKPAWADSKQFTRCGQIAESVGLEWAGRWVKFKEMAHCQYTGGLTLADLQAGKRPPDNA